jgi:hypothetical protein
VADQILALSDGRVIVDVEPGGMLVYGPDGAVEELWDNPHWWMRGHRMAVTTNDRVYLNSSGTVYLRQGDGSWDVVGTGAHGTEGNFRLLGDGTVEAGRPGNDVGPERPIEVGEWMFRDGRTFQADDGSRLTMGWFAVHRDNGGLVQTYAPPWYLRWVRWFWLPVLWLTLMPLAILDRRLHAKASPEQPH